MGNADDYLTGSVEKRIFREFSQPGRQIIVVGPNGQEKINLVRASLKQLSVKYDTHSLYILVTSTMTLEAFMDEIAWRLQLPNKPLVSEIVSALFVGNVVLVVDALERVTDSNLDLVVWLAELAKNMSDEASLYEGSIVKVIFTGMARTPDQLCERVQSLKSRLAVISTS